MCPALRPLDTLLLTTEFKVFSTALGYLFWAAGGKLVA